MATCKTCKYRTKKKHPKLSTLHSTKYQYFKLKFDFKIYLNSNLST